MGLPLRRGLLGIDEVRSVSHGLSGTAIGKPIGWKANGAPEIWSDHASPQTSDPVAIVRGIVNANTIAIATAGDVVEIPDTLLPASMPVNGGATNSRYLYWDSSDAKYEHTKPTDSQIETESIYWIGPSATAGYSVCIALHPNRPASVTEINGGSTGLKKLLGYHTENDLSPTSGSPYSLNPVNWIWRPTSPTAGDMGLTINGGNDRLTYAGANKWFLVTATVEFGASSITTGNLLFDFSMVHKNAGGATLENLTPVTFYIDDLQFNPRRFASVQSGFQMVDTNYLNAFVTIAPSVGADFAGLGYKAQFVIEPMNG